MQTVDVFTQHTVVQRTIRFSEIPVFLD